ncbi:MAG: hypothetical protein GAK35_00140 [Herbaspirillum frisingense]|uniref:MFS transporter n=1 Tax=Herbaspirillum frisingense TaxID=92645 RepID=A0A7V8JW09_9BURK|nr:MAG: hypothetical protein GAK35_00140 [Herbaspirillum frisingense]
MNAIAPALATAARTAAPAQPAFGLRIMTGLAGVLLAVLIAGLNENVTKMALADIRGAMGIGRDEGSWMISLYAATSVSAMAVSLARVHLYRSLGGGWRDAPRQVHHQKGEQG